MTCVNCPYVLEDIKERVCWSYHYSNPEFFEDDFEQSLWCDKVGGKLFWAGRCVDGELQNTIYQNCSKQRRRNKRERNQRYKGRIKLLAGFQSPVTYEDKIYIKGEEWVDRQKPYYKRYYRDKHKSGRYKYYKKHSNRCVRRYRGEIHSKGNQYRKIFDYWWTVD